MQREADTQNRTPVDKSTCDRCFFGRFRGRIPASTCLDKVQHRRTRTSRFGGCTPGRCAIRRQRCRHGEWHTTSVRGRQVSRAVLTLQQSPTWAIAASWQSTGGNWAWPPKFGANNCSCRKCPKKRVLHRSSSLLRFRYSAGTPPRWRDMKKSGCAVVARA